MAKREFLQLAHVFNEKKYPVAGWYVSEKLDGERCYWDGGISTGMDVREVPYANIEKDGRFVDQPIATGLWSRNGKVIHAPRWWTDRLPKFPFDGELYMGRKRFQLLSSIVRRIALNDKTMEEKRAEEWKNVEVVILDSPMYESIFAPGIIDTAFMKIQFNSVLIDWVKMRADKMGIVQICDELFLNNERTYERVYNRIRNTLNHHDKGNVRLINQIRLPYSTKYAMDEIERMLDNIVSEGGEGVMLRRPGGYWIPERSHDLLKVKKYHDAEAQVVGYTWGRGRLVGKMGALIVEWCPPFNQLGTKRVRFELSGFTDAERRLTMIEDDGITKTRVDASPLGTIYKGKECKPNIVNEKFPIGSMVTFKYRELTDDGKPKEGVYFRRS